MSRMSLASFALHPAALRPLADPPPRAPHGRARRREPVGEARRLQLRPRLRRQQDAQARVPRRGRARAGLRHARLDRRRAVEPHAPGRRRRRAPRARVRARAGALGRLAGRRLRPRRQHPALPPDGRRRAARTGRVRDRLQGELGAGARDVEAAGGKPYAIPAGASDHPLGGLGFAAGRRRWPRRRRARRVLRHRDRLLGDRLDAGRHGRGLRAQEGAAGDRHRRLGQARRDAARCCGSRANTARKIERRARADRRRR